MINLTFNAILALKRFLKDPYAGGDGLRITLDDNNEFILSFSNYKLNDAESINSDIKVYVDSQTFSKIQDLTVDYVIGYTGSGFKLINRGDVQCSCGANILS